MLTAYIVFLFLFLSFVDGQDLQPLSPNGLNVCQKQIEFEETYNVAVTYAVTEYRETCCAQFVICWDSCTKSSLAQRTRLEVRFQTKLKDVIVCCDGYRQEGDSCPLPTCEGGCLYGTCVSPNNCSCNAGFNGTSCKNDIDECLVDNGRCQQKCVNSLGSHSCVCFDGFNYNNLTGQCEDINECLVNEDLCRCVNEEQNVNCTASCSNTNGSYICQCSKGYFLADEKQVCADENECLVTNGNCTHTCINQHGTYKCRCLLGFSLQNDSKTCLDINECDTSNGGCTHVCVNNNGSYNCQCNPGYILDGNMKSCSDRDECKDSNHGCEYKCTNNLGSFQCACADGFQLNNDNKTCSDFNECDLIPGKSVTYSGCSNQCNNLIGSFNCSCDPGYVLASDNKTCIDDDECSTNQHACAHTCINTIGSFQCICKDGYKLHADKKTCSPEPCEPLALLSNGDASCYNGTTGSSCEFSCNNGFKVQGDATRWCLPNHKWNGTATQCQRKQCPSLNAPINGKLLYPCNNYYEGECTSECLDGYYLEGNLINQCLVGNDSNEMGWKQKQQKCKVSSACVPNPCLHGGICRPMNRNFTCDCSETMYKGVTCQIGILLVPQIHILTINQTVNNIQLEASPDDELNVTIQSDSEYLTIQPNSIYLTSTTTSQPFSLTGTKTGFYKLAFILGGENGVNFETPAPSFVYVDEQGDKEISINPDGTVIKGCFQQTANNLTFISNSRWNSNGVTNGVTQIVNVDGKVLTLSLAGGQVTDSGFAGVGLGENVIESSNTNQSQCTEGTTNRKSIASVLITNAVAYTMQTIFNKYSPYWLKVFVPMQSQLFTQTDLGGKLFAGQELINRPSSCSEGFTLIPTHTYYMFETQQSIDLLFPSNVILLPTTVNKCFIQDIMVPSNIYVTFSETSKNSITEFETTLSQILPFGIDMKKLNFVKQGDLQLIRSYGKRNILLESNDIKINMLLDGEMTWKTQNMGNLFNLLQNYDFTMKTKSSVKLNLQFSLHSNTESLSMEGFIEHITEEGRLGNYTLDLKLKVKGKVASTQGITNYIQFHDDSEIELKLIYDVTQSISIDSAKLADIQNEVNQAKSSFDELSNELTGLSTSDVKVSNLTSELILTFKELSVISNEILKLNDALKIIENLSLLRISATKSRKTFSLLLETYLNVDRYDNFGLELRFINYKSTFTKLISNTNVDFSTLKPMKTLVGMQISANSKICFQTYCVDDLLSTFDGFTKSLSGKMIEDIELAEYIKLRKDDTFMYNLTTETFQAPTVKTSLFNEIINQSSITLQNNEIKFQLRSDALIKMTKLLFNGMANIKTLTRQDSITFTFSTTLSTFTLFESEIKKYLLAMENSINQRRESIKFFLQRSKENALIEYQAYLNQTKKVNNLNIKLQSINENITQYQKQMNILKPKLSDLLSTVDKIVNISSLLEECQPNICISECVPGVLSSVCPRKQQIHQINHVCQFEEIEDISYEATTYEEVIEYTKYEDELITCSTKCPPLTGFFKDIFGRRRKKRFIAKAISAIAFATAFEHLGGTEGAIGATIGGVFGPIGSILGGVIGSMFGTCEESCVIEPTPSVAYRNITRVGYEPVLNQRQVPRCRNQATFVDAGFEYYYSCDTASKCADVTEDALCMKKQNECDAIRNEIEKQLKNPTYLQLQKEFMKTSVLLELNQRKKEILNSQLENAIKQEEITKSLSQIANMSNVRYEESLTTFNNAIQKEEQFVHEKKNAGIEFDGFFSFRYTDGMKSPQILLLSMNLINQKGNTTSFFDFQNYDRSVTDAVNEIIQLSLSVYYPKVVGRKRRAIATARPQPNQIESKCHIMQKAIIFMMQIIQSFHVEFKDYQSEIIQHEQTQIISTKYFEELRKSSSSLDIDVESIFSDVKENEQDFISWEVKYSIIISQLELLVASMGSTECYTLQDCVDYHVKQLKFLVQYDNKYMKFAIQIVNWDKAFKTLLNTPNVATTKTILEYELNSVLSTDPKNYFCGTVPELLRDLSGNLYIAEGEKLVLNIVLKSAKEDVTIIWKHEKRVLKHKNTFTFEKSVSLDDGGFYTCELINLHGTVKCNTVFVTVYKKLSFSSQPENQNGYVKSPTPLFLNCKTNNTDDGIVTTWHYRNIRSPTKIKLPIKTERLQVLQDNISKTGYYSCSIANKAETIESKEAFVNILKTSIATEQIHLQMELTKTTKRKRRNILYIYETEEADILKQAISKSLQINVNQISSFIVSIPDNGNAKLSFVIDGKNYTSSLDNLKSNETWNSISESISRNRDILFAHAMTLYYNADSLLIRDETFKINASSISITPMAVKCPDGQVVLRDGFVCADCPAGSKHVTDKCVLCPLNTYQQLPGQLACITCPINKTTEAEGTVAMSLCLGEEPTAAPTTLPTLRPTTPTSYTIIKKATDDNTTAIALGVAIPLLLIFIIITVAIFIYKRRKKNKEKSSLSGHANPTFGIDENQYTETGDDDVFGATASPEPPATAEPHYDTIKHEKIKQHKLNGYSEPVVPNHYAQPKQQAFAFNNPGYQSSQKVNNESSQKVNNETRAGNKGYDTLYAPPSRNRSQCYEGTKFEK